MYKSLILFLLFMVINTSVFSAGKKDSLFFRSVSLQHGLPGSNVSSILQDTLGFMWFGTNDGLCRYDGSQFKVYRHNANNPNSLVDNEVQKIHLDKSGNLWILTEDGVNILNTRTNEIQRLKSNGNPGEIIDNSAIDIVETNDGTLYVGSYYHGLSIRTNGNEITYLNDRGPSDGQLSSTHIRCLELFEDSLLIIGYWDAGIDIYDIKKSKALALSKVLETQLISSKVNTLCKDRDGGIWIGTNKGLAYLNLITNQLINYPYSVNSGFLTDNDITSLYVDSNDYLWIGTQNRGVILARVDDIIRDNMQASFRSYEPGYQEGKITYRTIKCIYEDKDNHIWVGTHGGGVNYTEEQFQRFSQLTYNPYIKNSLSYSKVWGITEATNGDIWVGTDGDGVNVWKQDIGIVKNYRHSKDDPMSLSDNAILCAITDYKGDIWLGTYQGGLNYYDKKTDSFIHYGNDDGLRVSDIRALCQSEDRKLWVGMNRGGLAFYNEQKGKFINIEALKDVDVRTIYADGNILWIGTYGAGFFKYNIQNDSAKHYNPELEKYSQIALKTVYSICKTQNGYLWLGTKDGGLIRMNIQTETFKEYSENEGLSNNNVHSILPDSNGNLWLSTNGSITQFILDSEAIINYDWRKGVQEEEFHDGSGLITRNGLFCFGGIKGMNYFYPDRFFKATEKQNIRFTDLKILSQEVFPNGGEVIRENIEFNPNIRLNHRHSVFTIGFQAIDYPFSNNVKYKYILEGYDQTWNFAGNINSATYRNLPPGDYTFKVETYGTGNAYAIKGASVQISMKPPFWKSLPAFILYIALMVVIVISIFRFRVQQYTIKNRIAYERKLRSEEKRIHNERLEFFTNISHELRTPITIIDVALDEIASLKNNNPKIRRSIEAALSNSARLMELINKVLEFRQVETGVSSLSVKEIKLNEFLNHFLQGFMEMAKHNKVHLRLTLPVNQVSLWMDQEKFVMILNNLLSNAFKHTPAGGDINISVNEFDEYLMLKVKDNGKGIPRHAQTKIFNRYFKMDNESTSTGIGLALTKSLVELHHAEIEVESNVNKGTSFNIKFLKGNGHFTNGQISELNDDTIIEKLLPEDTWDENQLHKEKDQKIMLLVDDNKDIVDLLEEKFSYEFKIVKAYDGKEGVEKAKKILPDFIISDIMMPVMSGSELCKELKIDTLTSHIPILLLTAKGTEEDEVAGLNIGADDYISKPFKMAILKARVNTIIENRIKLHNYFNNNQGIAETDNSPENEKELAFLNMVENYILKNCLDSEVSVFKLAEDLGFSRTTLYRKIKTLTGMSINAFVRSVKLKKSASLIAEGMNVSEAAYHTGFNDLKYFRESFKKVMGKNPSEYKGC